MILRLTPGPSRDNDQTATWSALHSSLVACRGDDLVSAVAVVAFALDSTLGLHSGADGWPEWLAADRAWWALHGAVTAMASTGEQRELLDRAGVALGALAVKLAEADDDERAVAAMEHEMVEGM